MAERDLESVSFWRQLMLTAALFAAEAAVVFEQIYSMLCLQYLGVPVALSTMHGVFSGITSVSLILCLGYLADKGPNTKKRKMLTVIFGCLSMLGGLFLIIAGNAIKTAASLEFPNNDNDSIVPTPLNYELLKPLTVGDSPELNSYDSMLLSRSSDISSSLSFEQMFYNRSPISPEMQGKHISKSSFPNISKNAYITNERVQLPLLTHKYNTTIEGDDGIVKMEEFPSTLTTVKPLGLNQTTPSMQPYITFIPVGVNATSTDYIPLSGILGILGFAVLDVGCDFCIPTLRAFLLDHTSKTQHSNILVTATLVCAISGTMTSLLGMVDIPRVLEVNFNVDGTATTFILVLCVLVIIIVSGFTSTIVTARALVNASKPRVRNYHRDTDNERTSLLAQSVEKGITYTSLSDISLKRYSKSYVRRDPMLFTGSDKSTYKFNSNSTGQEAKEMDGSKSDVHLHGVLQDASERSLQDFENNSENSHSSFLDMSGTPLGLMPTDESLSETRKCLPPEMETKKSSFFNRRLVIVMISTGFSFFAMALMSMGISHTLTIGVYHGDPDAPPGSKGNERYQKGLQAAASGSAVFYTSYLVTSAYSHKMSDLISERAQYILFHILFITASAGLVLTERIEMFYVTMVTFGPYRTCSFTLAFVLANKYTQDENTPDHSCNSLSNSKTGRVMALIGFFMPFGYAIRSGLAGPLIAASNVWSIVICGCVANAMATAVFSLLYFV